MNCVVPPSKILGHTINHAAFRAERHTAPDADIATLIACGTSSGLK